MRKGAGKLTQDEVRQMQNGLADDNAFAHGNAAANLNQVELNRLGRLIKSPRHFDGSRTNSLPLRRTQDFVDMRY